MLALLATLALTQTQAPLESFYGDYSLVVANFRKGRIDPKSSTYHFGHDGKFVMRAEEGKKRYVVHGHFKLGELEDLGRQWGRRLSMSVQNDNGHRKHEEMGETSLIWIPKLHSITDTMEVCYAKKGFEKEVLKTLADAKKEYEAQEKGSFKK